MCVATFQVPKNSDLFTQRMVTIDLESNGGSVFLSSSFSCFRYLKPRLLPHYAPSFFFFETALGSMALD